MLVLIENNAKQGAVSEDFDAEYKQLFEQINELKTAKIQIVVSLFLLLRMVHNVQFKALAG